MLSSKLNIALSTGTVKKTSSSLFFGKWSFIKLNKRSYTRSDRTCVGNFNSRFNERIGKSTRTVNYLIVEPILTRSLTSAPNFREKADRFGDLGDRKYEKVVLDEDEEKEEEFLKYEAKPNRRLVPSPGKYADMIKSHIKSGDLKAGIEVLNQVRKDRNKPDRYMYNLLMRAFAVQGDLKKCFYLYNQMKKEDLKPNLATYTSLMNACANCTSKQISLEKLANLRQLLIEKQVLLNAAHYNAMVKAYGRHGELLQAFQLVDEMHDKKLTIGISTLNFLLQGAISDKNAGFRHALVVWQLLRSRKLKPDIFTFNLLLRSARDCELGDVKIEDLLMSVNTRADGKLFVPSERTNLLAHPPEVCPHMTLIGDFEHSESLDETREIPKLNLDSIAPVANDASGSDAIASLKNVDNSTPVISLKSSSPQQNLLVMGGFKNFVSQMEADNVMPDIKTITYLMELVPPTEVAEKIVISYAKSRGVKLDIDFYNLLIKKRSFRFDYKSALKVLTMVQQDHLEPNIMTWGVLALTCRNNAQARELFEGMELSGHRPNIPIIGAILSQASNRWLFGVVLELMEKMRHEGPQPTERIYEILESFAKKADEMAKNKHPPDFVRLPFWQNGYRKFKLRYSSWVTEMNEEAEKKKERAMKKNKSR